MEIIIYNVELFLKNAEQPVASRWDAENEDDRLF